MTIAGPPPELEWMTFILVGEKFPKGDEDRMHALGEAWRQLATDLAPLSDQLGDVQEALSDAGNTPGIDEALKVIGELSTQFHATNSDLQQGLDQVAKGARTVAQEIEHAKIMIIVFAGLLAISLTQLITSAVLSVGGSAAALSTLLETLREAARRVLFRLMQAVIGGAIFMGGLDAAIQLLQIYVLHTRTRDEFNWKKVGLMAGIGGLAGAFGISLSVMRGVFTRNPVLLNEGFLFGVGRNLTSEGMAEYFADLLNSKGKLTDHTNVSAAGGALSGAVEGAVEGGRDILNRRRGGGMSDVGLDLGDMFGSTSELEAAINRLLTTLQHQPDPLTTAPPAPAAPTSTSTSTDADAAAAQETRDEQKALEFLTLKQVEHVLPAGIGTPHQHEQLRAVWQLTGQGLAQASGAPGTNGTQTGIGRFSQQLNDFSQLADGSYPAWAGLTHVELVTGHQIDQQLDTWQEQHPDSALSSSERVLVRESVLADVRQSYADELKQVAGGVTPTVAHAQSAVAQRIQGETLGSLVTAKLADAPVKAVGAANLADTPAKAVGAARLADGPAKAVGAANLADAPVKAVGAAKRADTGVAAASAVLDLAALSTAVPAVVSPADAMPGLPAATVAVAAAQVTARATAPGAPASDLTTDVDGPLNYLALPVDGHDHYALADGVAIPIPAGWYLSRDETHTPDDLAVAQGLREHRGPGGESYLTLAVHVANDRFHFGGRQWTAAEFAGVISSLPGADGRPIILVSCNAATVAAQLRDALGREVIAANGLVTSTVDGVARTHSIEFAASGRPSIAATAGWLRFLAEPGSQAVVLASMQLDEALTSLEVLPVQGPRPDATPLLPAVEWGNLDMDTVPPRLVPSFQLQEHVTDGVIRRGTLVGLHQWHDSFDKAMTFTPEGSFPGEVEGGHVYPQPGAAQFRAKYTTLFPRHLTWPQLLRMARQAYASAIAAGPVSTSDYRVGVNLADMEWRGIDNHGFPIGGRFWADGRVSTFYPSATRSHYPQAGLADHPFLALLVAVIAPVTTTAPVVAAEPPPAAIVPVRSRFDAPILAEGEQPESAAEQIERLGGHIDVLIRKFRSGNQQESLADLEQLSGLMHQFDEQLNRGDLPESHEGRYRLAQADLEWLRVSLSNRATSANFRRGRLHELLRVSLHENGEGIPVEWLTMRLRQLNNDAPAQATEEGFRFVSSLITTVLGFVVDPAAPVTPGSSLTNQLAQAHAGLVTLLPKGQLELTLVQGWMARVAADRPHDAPTVLLAWLFGADLVWREPADVLTPAAAQDIAQRSLGSLAEVMTINHQLIADKVLDAKRLEQLEQLILNNPVWSASAYQQVKLLVRLAAQELRWARLQLTKGYPSNTDARQRLDDLTKNSEFLSGLMGVTWTEQATRTLSDSPLPFATKRRLPLEIAAAGVSHGNDATAANWQALNEALRTWGRTVPAMEDLNRLAESYSWAVARAHGLANVPNRGQLLEQLTTGRAEVFLDLAKASLLSQTPIAEMALLALFVLPSETSELLLTRAGLTRDSLLAAVTAYRQTRSTDDRAVQTVRLSAELLVGKGQDNLTMRLGMLKKLVDAIGTQPSNVAGSFYGQPWMRVMLAEQVRTVGPLTPEAQRAQWNDMANRVDSWQTGVSSRIGPDPVESDTPLPGVQWPVGHLLGSGRHTNFDALRGALDGARMLAALHTPSKYAVNSMLTLVTTAIVPAFHRGQGASQTDLLEYLDFLEQHADAVGVVPDANTGLSKADIVRALVRLMHSDIQWQGGVDPAAAPQRLDELEQAQILVDAGQITIADYHRVYTDTLLKYSDWQHHGNQPATVELPESDLWTPQRRALAGSGAGALDLRVVYRHGLVGWISPSTGVATWFTPAGVAIGSPVLKPEYAQQLAAVGARSDELSVLIGRAGEPLRAQWLAAVHDWLGVLGPAMDVEVRAAVVGYTDDPVMQTALAALTQEGHSVSAPVTQGLGGSAPNTSVQPPRGAAAGGSGS